MPEWKRTEILELISEEDLAEAAHERFKQKAGQGDGYAAAFLYALNGDAKHLETARQWLLDWPRKAGYVRHYRKRLNTPNSIKAGQPWLGDVYYDLNITQMVAYDWLYAGLDDRSRKAIEDGILVGGRFWKRCMDRWTQTPNLVFKPTFMAALAGLVTQDRNWTSAAITFSSPATASL